MKRISVAIFLAAFVSFLPNASGNGHHGFEKVFRYTNEAGVHIGSFFEYGVLDSNHDASAHVVSSVRTQGLHRSEQLKSKLEAAKEVMVVIYDANGDVAENILFKGTGDMKSWFSRNNLVSNLNWDISGNFNFFSVDGDVGNGRKFYIHRSYGGCGNDIGFFLVACSRDNGQVPCTNYETVPNGFICKIMYTATGNAAKYATNQIAVGSAMEIYVTSNTPHHAQFHGFHRVFRYPNQAGVDVMSFFEDGVVDSTQDRSQMTVAEVNTKEMFRDEQIAEKLENARQVMVVIYDADRNVAETILFKGTGDSKSWFSKDTMVSNYNWEISGNFNFFSIDGHADSGRRFYINRSWGGCGNDNGYFLVTCNKANGQPACGNYETVPNGHLCKILHTSSDQVARFGTSNVAEGSAFEIYVHEYPPKGQLVHGFESVFRYPNLAGVHIASFFESGCTDSHEDASALTASQVKTNKMFRSPDFEEKLKAASEIIVAVLDARGDLAAELHFRGTGDMKSWFSKANLISSGNWNLGNTFNFFSIDGHVDSGRKFYINRSWGGCGNDNGFLLVACSRPDGNPACANYESVPDQLICKIMYTNTGSVARFGTAAISEASAIEILVPGFVSQFDGFERVFRYPNQAGVHIESYFNEGITDSTHDCSDHLSVNDVKVNDMYRSEQLPGKLTSARQIMVVIYDAAGNVAQKLTFQGTGDMHSWFARDKLHRTDSWNMNGGYNFFSIAGHADIGRKFYINRSYGGCGNDWGYFLVACLRPDGGVPCTNYESVPSGHICKILHTTTGNAAKYGTAEMPEASAMEIYVNV